MSNPPVLRGIWQLEAVRSKREPRALRVDDIPQDPVDASGDCHRLRPRFPRAAAATSVCYCKCLPLGAGGDRIDVEDVH